ncbi:MAG: hypothetical protein ACREEE_15415 [Dongiaceae bacterium]
MDDLLKVFLVETSQGLGECDADIDRLRAAPNDAAALTSILRLVGSVRETSSFLGLPGLHAAAAAAVGVLTKIKNGAMPGGTPSTDLVRRAIADIKASVMQLEQSVAGADPIYEAHRKAESASSSLDAAEAPPAPSKRPVKKKQTLIERFASEDANTGLSKPDGNPPVPSLAPPEAVRLPAPNHRMDSAPREVPAPSPDVVAARSLEIATVAAKSEPAVVQPAGDGTVRISAETLEHLLATVRQLMATQTEMMQLIKQKDDAARLPAAASPSAAHEHPGTTNMAATPVLPVEPTVAQAPAETKGTDAPASAGPIIDKVVTLPTRRPASAEPGPSGIRPTPPPGTQRFKLLVFQSLNGATKAVRADLVVRMRDGDLKTLDGARGLWVLRTEERLVPLVSVDGGMRPTADGLVPVLLCNIDGAWMGLLVRHVVGTVDAELAVAGPTGRHNRIATVLVDGMAVDVIDPARCLSDAIDGPARKSRTPDAAKEPGPAPSTTVVQASDLFERKPSH